MSRIGRLPIAIPKGVTVEAKGRNVTVTGPKGSLCLLYTSDAADE